MKLVAFFPFLFAAIVLGSPMWQTRDDTDVYCGTDEYTAAEIQAAADASCQYVSEGSRAGNSKYPEVYGDYEGFAFDGVEGPYYEFPILRSGKIYSGEAPGADRVIINSQCVLAGEITHTGASGNDFVACSGTS